MAPRFRDQSAVSRAISAKADYSKLARKKLVDSRAKLCGINAAIDQAISTGRLKPSSRLERAQQAMELNLTAAETRLEALQKSGEGEWEELRDRVDDAWEDLSRSIKKLVALLADAA